MSIVRGMALFLLCIFRGLRIIARRYGAGRGEHELHTRDINNARPAWHRRCWRKIAKHTPRWPLQLAQANRFIAQFGQWGLPIV